MKVQLLYIYIFICCSVLKRLELSTKIFYHLTNNMEDLLQRAKAENMQIEPRD